ncbi:multiheme c-type cytochrome [Marinobacter sp. CHS3-4]|uniref:multiheme c-type cytochrome n=1 Tax=Marinobacter sp. CHS3-4 TaxID=3045174 RepID=UPI0024B53EB8|nr:multiheme c-type cytochrome [Marinobacter sp. CHS3-4]MDI9245944.1 multiheme c-type cytochrome [Marinobacter sp. CHS3-4]
MTIAKGFLLFCFLALFTGGAAHGNEWNPEDVMGYKECAKCHKPQIRKWQETAHHETFREFHRQDKAKQIAETMGVDRVRDTDAICADCHYTVGMDRGRERVISGISCESCHGPATDWIAIHQPEGNGVKREYEAPHDRQERHAKVRAAGMIIPSDTYGFANNCMGCHLTPNEKLVNTAEHPAGSSFDLMERLEKVRHGPEPDANEKNMIKVIGYAVELEHSLRGLAQSKEAGRYRDKMQERLYVALANLNGLAKLTGAAPLKGLLSEIPKAYNPTDSASLLKTADQIQKKAQKWSDDKIGDQFTNAVNHKHIASAPVPSAPSSQPKAPEPQPAPEPAPKPAEPEPAPQPAPQPEPEPAPQQPEPAASPAVQPDPAPTPAPTVPATPKVEPKPAPSKPQPLVSEFGVYTPQSRQLCDTDNPWLLGKVPASQTRLASESCFGVDIQARPGANVYLISQSSGAAPLMLLPDPCNAFGGPIAKGRYHVPNASGQPTALRLDPGAGEESFHLVVIDNADANEAFQSITSALPDACGNYPSQQLTQSLEDSLRAFEGNHSDVDWSVIRFSHD